MTDLSTTKTVGKPGDVIINLDGEPIYIPGEVYQGAKEAEMKAADIARGAYIQNWLDSQARSYD